MQEAKQSKIYNLDSSGIMHLAVLRKGKANTFRMSVTLKEDIKPDVLQLAVNAVTPRFPTIVAKIKEGFFRYYVIPVDTPPQVKYDRQCLVYMPMEEIKKCATRVLYSEKKITIEIFHSLTDGYGGFVFLKTLIAEYLRLEYKIECSQNGEILSPKQEPQQEETTDSFLTYPGDKKTPFNHVVSYLPGEGMPESPMNTTAGAFDVEELLDVAHKYHVSLTTLLTAVMAKSIMEMQEIHHQSGKNYKPVQLMVPADLRRIFPSKTLRNFSLYALPCVHQHHMKLSFEEFVHCIGGQLKEQFTKERMGAMIATNVALEKNFFLSRLPLKVKCVAVRTGFHFIGKRNTSLTLSNLGEWKFPEEMQVHIEKIGVFLSARVCSPYNCCAVTYNGKLYFNFSRCCPEPELEPIFFRNLCQLGCVPELEINGTVYNFEKYLIDSLRCKKSL